MSGTLALRLAAIGLAALAILVAALQARRHPAPALPVAAPPAVQIDPARAELARCQALGAAGAQDPGCLKAWADQRTRFLGVRAPADERR